MFVWEVRKRKVGKNPYYRLSTFVPCRRLQQFPPQTWCAQHLKHDKRDPGLLNEEFSCTEMLCLGSKRYCCFYSLIKKCKLSSNELNRRTFWKQWRRTHGKIPKSVGWNRKWNFYQSCISHKEFSCSNLPADKEKIHLFSSERKCWGRWNPYSSIANLNIIHLR